MDSRGAAGMMLDPVTSAGARGELSHEDQPLAAAAYRVYTSVFQAPIRINLLTPILYHTNISPK